MRILIHAGEVIEEQALLEPVELVAKKSQAVRQHFTALHQEIGSELGLVGVLILLAWFALALRGAARSPLLVGLVVATATYTLFSGNVGHVSAFQAIATLPVAAWEFSLGVWLVVKGFKPCPITAEVTAADTAPAYHDVTV
jgi:putative Ca2+/H+ antiporter (TMEM165/GDT1 family)